MNKKNKNPNVPNLRFKNFENDWKNFILGNITESCGGGTPSTKNSQYWKGNIPWISSSDLFDNDIRTINMSRYITNEAMHNSSTKLCPKGTICVVSRVGVGKVAVSKCEICTSQDFVNIIKYDGNKYFLAQLIQIMIKLSQLQGTSIKGITSKDINSFKLRIPTISEQDKIMQFLDLIESRIQTQIKIIDDLKLQKKVISNEIFKSVNRKPNGIIRDFIDYEQPTKYIVKNTDYVNKNENSIPVLTANQAFILGYTNDNEGVYDFSECVIFDDFTMDLKYVDFPFKVKSSAIKILTPKNNVNIKYIYEYLKHLNLSSQEHKRHYISEVEVLDVFIPTIEVQNNKLQIINTFNEKLENEKAILNSYIQEKNYLLNNMFI